MKISLYTEKEASLYIKKTKRSGLLSGIFLFLAIGCFAMSILLATYESKAIWMPLGSFLVIVPSVLSFLFFLKRKHVLDGLYLYRQIMESEGERFYGAFVSMKEHPITLSNGFEVYEVILEEELGERKMVYVPSDKMGSLKMEKGKIYYFKIVSQYLAEVQDD